MSNKKNKMHYVNNSEFLQHMKKHIELVKLAKSNNQELPKVSEYIGECIYSIANKLANKPNFMNYPFREEMVSDGIENSLQYINNFNPDKSSNPFAYFTQIIYFAFVRRIQKEKRLLYAKYRMIEEVLSDISENEYIHTSKYGSDYSDLNMHEFMENFEISNEKKKTKIKNIKKKNIGFDDIFEQLANEINFVDEIEIDENSEPEKK